MLFQCEDTDPVRLNDELISFAKTLMARVVVLGYAEPDNTEWEQHIVHVMSCGLGVIFLYCLKKSTLSDSEKGFLLESCRKFITACIKSVL